MLDAKLKNYLTKSFLTGTLKTAVVTLSTLIFLPLIVRKIGLEHYGLISLTMIFGGVVVFADFGMAKAVTLLIGRDKSGKEAGAIVSNALVINLAIVAFIGAVFALLLAFNVPILGEALPISDELKNYIVFIGFVLLSIMLLNNLLIAILEAHLLMHHVNVVFTVSSVALNAFIYLTSCLTESMYILLASPIASFLVVSVYLVSVVRLHTKVSLVKPNVGQMKSMLSLSCRFLNISLINTLVIPGNKYILVLITGSSADLGAFDIALKIGLIASSLLNSLAHPLFGVFVNMSNKNRGVYIIANQISGLLFVLYLVGCATYYFIGEHVTYFLSGSVDSQLFFVSFVLLWGIGFSSVAEPFYRALLAAAELNLAFLLKLIIPIANIFLFFSMTDLPNLQKVSVAYASALFISSAAVILYSLSRQILKAAP